MNGTAAASHILVPGRDRYSNQHVDVHYAGGGKLRFRRANGGGWEMRRTQADNSARFEPTQLVAGFALELDDALVRELSPNQQLVLADLREHGPSTTKAIAERVGMTTRAASNVLTWLRGLRYVSDGSTSTPIAGGFAHTPAKSPITWTALP
jgi:hypothetical protein